MATASKTSSSKPNAENASKFSPNASELDSIERCLKDEQFRQLLVDYAQEMADPANRARQEEELVQLEAERGFDVTFLHPTPGYVIKTTNLVNDEKVFVNVCADDNVAAPVSKTAPRGVEWSIPYSQAAGAAAGRRDCDRAGRPCVVFDVVFHPEAIAMANKNNRLRALVSETALDAVDRASRGNGVKLQRDQLKYPKMKLKGAALESTVIRTPKQQQEQHKEDGFREKGQADVKTPEHVVKYRHNVRDVPTSASTSLHRRNVDNPCRPTEIVVEILLPEMDNAAGLDLDVQEHRLTLDSDAPVRYHLEVPFAYPVIEDDGSAKFEKSTKRLVVTAPVKPDKDVQRLVSTDSGIDVDIDCIPEQPEQQQSNAVTSTTSEEEDPRFKDLHFPDYSVNIYEDLMIFTLNVKNVAERTLSRPDVIPDPLSFGLTFSSIGKGGVPMDYGFFCCLVAPPTTESSSLKAVDVEVWDNNVIVKVTLPQEMGVSGYQVGASPTGLSEHSLPRFQQFRERKEQRKAYSPESATSPLHIGRKNSSSSSKKNDSSSNDSAFIDDKERHNSGGGEDSAVAFSPGILKHSAPVGSPSRFVVTPTQMDVEQAASADTGKGILKRRSAQRCMSESNADGMTLLSWTGSDASSIDENSSIVGSQKKSVRFNETVKRQIFRPNASILGQKAKNMKKLEQKKRRTARRASEGDASVEDGSYGSFKLEAMIQEEEDGDEEELNDSGLEEDNKAPKSDGGKNKNKAKKNKKKTAGKMSTKLSNATTDLIFDIDF